jgi:predicted O-methyltransferase YrrM
MASDPPDPDSSELPMLDVFLPMMKSGALISAGEIGLFEALAAGPRTLQELADLTSTDEVALSRLTDFLLSIGYLESAEGRITNSKRAQEWFTDRGRVNYSAGLRWSAEAWKWLPDLVPTLRKGAAPRNLWAHLGRQPELGQRFASYMKAFAEHLSPDLLAHVKIPSGARRLLDLGGSHGLHSIAFCRAYPELEAVIVDLPSSLAKTASWIEQAGLSARIHLRAADLRARDWGEGYDAALLLSVGHNQSAADNQATLDHAARVLKPGATLVIHDYLANPTKTPYVAAFRLTLLLETGTRTYALEDFAGWLDRAGFEAPVCVELDPIEKGHLLISRRR